MIFVNNLYPNFEFVWHKPWDGFNPFSDFILPWFLFMVGTSMPFSYKELNSSNKLSFLNRTIIRSVKLFFIG